MPKAFRCLAIAALLALAAAGCRPGPQNGELDPAAANGSAGAAADAQSLHIATDDWYQLFRPVKISVSYFTEMRDFSGDGIIDGLDVRVTPEDRFGDAAKALGSFRIQAFAYVPRDNNPRGAQIANWFVSVSGAEELEQYWDSTDRAFHFPLALNKPVDAGRVIIQVTYYVPDGSGTMLFGERIIRVAP